MSEPTPAETSETIPTPRDFDEFEVWVERLNNQLARKQELEAARDEAVAAVMKSHEPSISPHRDYAELLLAGVKQFVIENESKIKKRYGRKYAFRAFILEFNIAQESLRTVSAPELVRQLEKYKFTNLLRYTPVLAKNPAKVAYRETRPFRRRALLRKIFKETGTYVSRHQTAKLTLPSLQEPLELQERRYPAVGLDADDD